MLVSSHLLAEMAATADDLVVIGGGRLIAAQTVRAFIATHTRAEVVVRTPRADVFEAQLRRSGVPARREGPDVLVAEAATSEYVSTLAARCGVPVHELHTRSSSLGDAFLAATAESAQYRGVTA